MAPNINAATVRVFDALGVQLLVAKKTGSFDAIYHSLNDHDGVLDDMRRNIDARWSAIEAGAEAIVMTTSGSRFFPRSPCLLRNSATHMCLKRTGLGAGFQSVTGTANRDRLSQGVVYRVP